jgi:hypothetical protein
MEEGRLPKRALKWMPKQKRARGRPKKNWNKEGYERKNPKARATLEIGCPQTHFHILPGCKKKPWVMEKNYLHI